ncbi:junctional sarcoplasmic reticulum protein 1-like isoform X2 [Rhinatrema bivittatum]|nr:junctional sarcoplasmic reticulum protein 1-like isoform X2 [Rhinatrema bivittatum]
MSKSKEKLSGRLEEKEPKKIYELQITEDLDEFVESVSEIPKAAQEPIVKPEKAAKRSSVAKADSKPVSARKKTEPSGAGPGKADIPWEGVTLNKCLIVASFVALLSMGFQVLQDAVDMEDEVLEVDTIVWTQPESSPAEDITEELPEPWFFESWFRPSEEEPDEADTEAEEIPETTAASTVLKETGEELTSSVKRTEEEKQTPAMLKQIHKLEKPELERASKRDLHSQDKYEEVKSSKIWKSSKEKILKEEDKHSPKMHGEEKAKHYSREVKGQPFFKARGEGKPSYPKPPPGKHESDFRYEHGRLHKARENSSHDYRAQKEHRDARQREQDGKPFIQDKFFPRKDKKEGFYAKHKHRESKRHD